MGKAFMWTFVGFCLGLAVDELRNGVPAKKVNYDRYEVRYIYRPYPNQHYYNYRVHPDTFNNQRPQRQSSNGNNGETRTNTQTQTFDHTSQQRTESWGTKN